jgi:prepilin-type N-terminal cleavage/methylation domain-containing protein
MNLAFKGRTFSMKHHSTTLVRLRAGPRGRRGFSLVEMMAVVVIIGVILVIGGGEISKAWKRQKLQSASADIKVLFQRAYSEVQRRGIPVFVQVGPLTTVGASRSLPIYLVGDQTQDEVLDCFQKVPTVACPDLLIDQYNIVVTGLSGTLGISGVDQEFCLSDASTSQVLSTLWSDENPGPGSPNWTVARVLMCDLQGRAMSVGPKAAAPKAGLPASTGRQIGAPATLVLSHVEVVHGSFQPPTRYVLSINPVWSVRVIKQIATSRNPDLSFNWVTQNG